MQSSTRLPWVVIKYGGTSVATVTTWRAIVRRVCELLPTNRVWLVVSALTQVTNALLRSLDEALAPSLVDPDARLRSFTWISDAHTQLGADMGLSDSDFAPVAALLEDLKRLLDGITLTQEVSPKLRARVAAFGELLSSQLGVAFLRRNGCAGAVRVDSRSLLTSVVDESAPVSESDAYLEADVRPSIQVDRSDIAAQGASVVICQGFIASTPGGATCLLGRGGSDTSAALFAALVGAVRLEIWTDVNGMFTADPRHVPRARLIRSLTYREAQELAAMGAKVLHPRCLVPAAHAGVPVEVRNTMDPRPSADMTVVSATGLDYHHASASSASSSSMRCGANTAAAGAASAVAVDGHSGDASGRRGSCGFGGGDDTRGGDTPRFEESSVSPPPAPTRSPSSSKIVYSSSDGFSGGRDSPYDGPSSSSSSWSPRNSVAAPPSAEVLSSVKPKVLAVARRKGVTLVNMSAFDMWGHSGFLSRVFAPFSTHGVSVDLIATSQYAVSVTLDHIPDGVHGDTMRKVIATLSKQCTTSVRHPCAVVSIVGRSLRNALPELGRAMQALKGISVHMVSEASEDLNMSFVVDEEHADVLVKALHAELLEKEDIEHDAQFGPIWSDMPCGSPQPPAAALK